MQSVFDFLASDSVEIIDPEILKLEQEQENFKKVLTPSEAIIEMDKAISLYKEGKINYIVFDLETSALKPWLGEIIMFSFCYGDIGYVVPITINNRNYSNLNIIYSNIDYIITKDIKFILFEKLKELLQIPIVGHNLKFDLNWLTWFDLTDSLKIKIYCDTMLFAHILGNKELSLKALSAKFFNLKKRWDSIIDTYLDATPLSYRNYSSIPTSILAKYAGLDVYYNFKLYEKLKSIAPENVIPLLKEVTQQVYVFSEIETKGVKVDQEVKKFLDTSYITAIDNTYKDLFKLPTVSKLLQENILTARKSFDFVDNEAEHQIKRSFLNLNSSKINRNLFYSTDYYNLPIIKRFLTKGNKTNNIRLPQTNKDVIEYFLGKFTDEKFIQSYKIKNVQETIQFLNYLKKIKKLESLKSKYINVLDELCYMNILYPDYYFGVRSGRLGSNFHGMPKGDIKRMYKSRWEEVGGLFLAVDFSQIELRIAHSLANEEKMIQAFLEGKDPHKLAAAGMYNVNVEDVTSEMRGRGKKTNFAVLYGEGAESMAIEWGIGLDEAKRFITAYFAGFPSLTAWMGKLREFALSNGYIITPFNRKILIDNYNSKDSWHIAEALRCACNYPVQCLVGSTKIKLLNGQNAEIKSLCDLKEPIWVYSYDLIKNEIVPTRIKKVFKSGETKIIYRVTLNNFETIDTTPNHLYLLRNGEYIEARNLKIGNSLMPIYTGINGKDFNNNQKFNLGYLGVYQNNTGNWDLVHRLVAKKIINLNIDKKSIHHIDKNKFNNYPENLEILSPTEHIMKHKEDSKIGFKLFLKTKSGKKWLKKITKILILNKDRGLIAYKNFLLTEKGKIYLKNLSLSMIEKNKNINKKYPKWAENLKKAKQNQIKKRYKIFGNVLGIPREDFITKLKDSWEKTKEKRKEILKKAHRNKKSIFKYGIKIRNIMLSEKMKYNTPNEWDSNIETLKKDKKIARGLSRYSQFFLRYGKWEEFLDFLNINNNHKIIKIEKILLDNPIDVYDMEEPVNHNFALSAGIFVHNSTATEIVNMYLCKNWKEMKNENLKSIIIGEVHDSIETDVFPGELFTVLKKYIENCKKIKYDFLRCPLELSAEMGTSWGGSLELKIKELTDTSLIFESTGLKMDVEALIEVAKRAYKIEYNIIKEIDIDINKKADTTFYKDIKEIQFQMKIQKNN